MDVIWDDTQKVTQTVNERYNSDMFDEQQLMDWEDKTEIKKRGLIVILSSKSITNRRRDTSMYAQKNMDSKVRQT